MSAHKKVTGYQLFLKERIETVRNNNTIAPTDRVKTIAAMWRTQSNTEKQFWIEAAGSQKLNGYQKFVKAQMPAIKLNNSIAAKDRLKEIAKLWQALSPLQKQSWAQ